MQTFIYDLIYSGAWEAFRKIIQHKEIWFVLQYKTESFQEIVVMYKTKYCEILQNI